MQNPKIKYYLLLVIIFLIVFGASESSKKSFIKETEQIKESNIKFVKIGGQILKTELALTSEMQQKGLSGRKELKEDESMLFVFNYPNRYSFWMKEMNFPIDIIWINEDLKVVYIKKNATPESYPASFLPNENASYVLEVFSSFSDKNNLQVGDKVEFLSS